jgi:hypothetical protein
LDSFLDVGAPEMALLDKFFSSAYGNLVQHKNPSNFVNEDEQKA